MDETKGLNKNATRMLTGFIMGTITMGCIMLGGVALLLLLSIVIFFASKEYVKILEHKGFYPSLKIMLAAEALLAVITFFDRTEYVALALALCTFAAFMWVLFRGRQPYIANVSTTILGFVYCGYFPLHLQLLLSQCVSLPGLNSTRSTIPSSACVQISPIGRSATIFPWLMIITRSQIASTSCIIWVDNNTVFFFPVSLIKCLISSSWFGSSPVIGSSRIRISGSCTKACANPTLCLYPFDNCPIFFEFPARVRFAL